MSLSVPVSSWEEAENILRGDLEARGLMGKVKKGDLTNDAFTFAVDADGRKILFRVDRTTGEVSLFY